MNIDYFKERFKNTESTYLLARRANSPDLNPHALRAIEEIITARGERLPVLVIKSGEEQQPLKETKADSVRRLVSLASPAFTSTRIRFNFDIPSFPVLQIGIVVAAIALTYNVFSLKIIAQDEATPRWYLHGLVYTKTFDELQKKLEPYKIKIISRGCIVDDDVYAKDIQHNQQMYEAAPPELKLVLGEPQPRI